MVQLCTARIRTTPARGNCSICAQGFRSWRCEFCWWKLWSKQMSTESHCTLANFISRSSDMTSMVYVCVCLSVSQLVIGKLAKARGIKVSLYLIKNFRWNALNAFGFIALSLCKYVKHKINYSTRCRQKQAAATHSSTAVASSHCTHTHTHKVFKVAYVWWHGEWWWVGWAVFCIVDRLITLSPSAEFVGIVIACETLTIQECSLNFNHFPHIHSVDKDVDWWPIREMCWTYFSFFLSRGFVDASAMMEMDFLCDPLKCKVLLANIQIAAAVPLLLRLYVHWVFCAP